jgi:hypothetical protein
MNRMVAILVTITCSLAFVCFPLGSATRAEATSLTSSSSAAGGFSDVGSDYWASTAIQSLVQAGVVNGYSDGSFRPEQSVSRAEFAKMIVTALDLPFVLVEYPSFSDVPGNHWALTYVETALMNDLMKGYPDGLFQPSGEITLAEILTVLTRAKDWPLVDPPDPPPQLLVWDADGSVRPLAPSDWFYQTVGAAMAGGLLSFPEDPHLASSGPGSNEYSINFQLPATRAQTAFLLDRMMR